MRILLVEDDPDLSRQLKGALSDAGYAVDHAPDGEEAHFLPMTRWSSTWGCPRSMASPSWNAGGAKACRRPF